jgi:hypothetical protein
MKMIELIILLKQNNFDISVDPITFESLIPRARNAVSARFLDNKQATHLLFIDCDIVFEPKDVLKLFEANRPVISGVYPKKYHKGPDAKYPVDFSLNGQIILTEQTNVFEAELLATGFMLIQRQTLEEIINKNPDICYKNNIDGYTTANNMFYNFFQLQIDEQTKFLLSEDYGFCNLCKKSGIKVYIYSDITLTHIGFTPFTGNLQEYLNIIKN